MNERHILLQYAKNFKRGMEKDYWDNFKAFWPEGKCTIGIDSIMSGLKATLLSRVVGKGKIFSWKHCQRYAFNVIEIP